jgi:hypothetical protein
MFRTGTLIATCLVSVKDMKQQNLKLVEALALDSNVCSHDPSHDCWKLPEETRFSRGYGVRKTCRNSVFKGRVWEMRLRRFRLTRIMASRARSSAG